MSRTVVKLKNLRPYDLCLGPGNTDPFVKEIYESRLEQETLAALDQYISGMYDIDLHYASFLNYDRTTEQDDQWSNALTNHPSFIPAFNSVRRELSHIRATPIPTNQLDSVFYQGSLAAGYGYVGLKRDNYYKARANASRALYDYDKWRNRYRFVPDKAYARCQLTLRANPKVRHIWGRPFHHVLLEGCIAQPVIEQLLVNDSPIYVGKDLHKDLPYDLIAMLESGDTAYCIDFSKLDSTLCRALIHSAWLIMRELCPPQAPQDVLNYELWEYLFKHTILIMPDGQLFEILAGLPSGSYFTQLIGSICNFLLIYMYLVSIGQPDAAVKVLGDDSLFILREIVIKVESIAEFFAPFGMF